jgi:Phosphotransferase enzyme family
MTLAPALTWMQLFPRDASFEYDATAPDFARAPGTAKPQSGQHAVRVGGEKLDHCEGFVGINSRVSDAELKSKGLGYVRRFAVLPDLKTARWFVPLDSPGVSSAGFALYSPAKFSARLKVAAARLATHSRLSLWYRDEIVIAQRELPPIERKMMELFPGVEIRLALSSGAPEPARNRKTSIAVIATDGKIVGFAKVAGSELSLRLLRDESRMLPELARRKITAPDLIFAEEVDGAFVMVQKPLNGKPVTARFGESKQVFLRSLRSDRMVRASDSSFVTTLAARIENLPASHHELADALHDVLPVLDEMQIPATIVHGDFAPWNLREHDGQIAAFDWEYAEVDGLPLIDETHYRIQVGYLLEKWNIPQAVASLGRVHLENDLSLTAKQVRALQVVYLIDNLTRLFGEGYDEAENEMVAWYGRLLKVLVGTRKEMAAA